MRKPVASATSVSAAALSLLAVIVWLAPARPGVRAAGTFAGLVAELSEPGGYFDTDNLISNEKSYLHVIPALRDANVHGGAYLGVGPDQNFSYIAEIRPAIAFIVDIRRDNLLLHLLFKALFAMAPTRADYLAALTGRPRPPSVERWQQADLTTILDYIDATPRAGPESLAALRDRIDAAIRSTGVPLSVDDFETIDRFHRTFIEQGLSLRFHTAGRPPRSHYPTYRELLLETDRQGTRGNFLATDERFQIVRRLQQQDLVVPVVGDLAGGLALRAVSKVMAERGHRLSAFYTSNVEFYLARRGTLDRFVDNLARLPRTARSVIIRSVFDGRGPSLPESVPGYYSVSIVRPVDDLVDDVASRRGGHALDVNR